MFKNDDQLFKIIKKSLKKKILNILKKLKNTKNKILLISILDLKLIKLTWFDFVFFTINLKFWI